MAEDFLIPEIQPHTADDNKSGSMPASYVGQTKYWLEAAYEEACYDQGQSEELKLVNKHIDYIRGNQWKGVQMASYKARPVINIMERLYWELVSLLTDIEPVIEVKANSKEENLAKQEKVINKVIRSWWTTNSCDLQLALVIQYAILTTGFAKFQWNPHLMNGDGDMEMMPVGPHDLIPLKARFTLESAQAQIYKEIMPLWKIRAKFPTRGQMVEADAELSRYTIENKPSGINDYKYRVLSPSAKKLVGGSTQSKYSAFPQALYREFWLKDPSMNTSNRTIKMGKDNWAYEVSPGGRIYPRGRLICMAGREIMHDGPNPYWHGRFPFAMLRLNAAPFSIYGLSELPTQESLEDIINGLTAGILNVVKKAVNPTFMAPKNALSEQVWENFDPANPNARMAFSPSAAHEPKFSAPPQLPSYVLHTLQDMKRELNMSSGISAMSDMAKKKQMPAGDTLDQIRSIQNTPIRLKGRNIEQFIRTAGEMMVPNIFQFYPAGRRFSLFGNEGLVNEDFDWDPGNMVPAGSSREEHAKRFRFQIQEGSLLSFQREEQVNKLIRLRMGGDLDRKTFFKLLNMDLNVDEIEKNLKQERAEGLGAAPPKGRKPKR